MVPRGLEPRTLRLLAVRSNQLSYETSLISLTSENNTIDRQTICKYIQKLHNDFI